MTFDNFLTVAAGYDNFPSDFTYDDFDTALHHWRNVYDCFPRATELIKWIIENKKKSNDEMAQALRNINFYIGGLTEEGIKYYYDQMVLEGKIITP